MDTAALTLIYEYSCTYCTLIRGYRCSYFDSWIQLHLLLLTGVQIQMPVGLRLTMKQINGSSGYVVQKDISVLSINKICLYKT